MPEALTESFCERCGTRYEFAAPTHLSGLRKTRGLISGLRNYIMSQDTLSDAVGDAIRSEEEVLAAAQLDAFHDSFNFCIQCRQYTCVNCWNDSAGRCRTCVPIAGTDDLIERFEASFTAQHAAAAGTGVVELDEADLNRRLGVEAWPSADLSTAGNNGSQAPEWPTEQPQLGQPEEVAVTADVDEPEVTDLVVVAESDTLEPALPAVAQPAIAASAAAAAEAAALAWEDDAAFELEPEPEPTLAEVEVQAEVPEAAPEPIVAEVPEAAPEPIVAAVDAGPEVEVEAEVGPGAEVGVEVAPEPAPEPPAPRPILPISETILRVPRVEPTEVEPVAAEPIAAELHDPALAARRAKLDLLGLGDPGEGPVSPTPGNVLPYRSRGASVHPVEGAARQAAGIAAVGGSFWEASAREVAGVSTNVGVQSCGECGLSLSASARFCRRCGTPQARSA